MICSTVRFLPLGIFEIHFYAKGSIGNANRECTRLPKTDQKLNAPNFKLQLCHVTGADRFSMARGMGVDNFSGFSLQVFYLKPKSLGSVHIGSKDPFSSPKIIANYLSDEEDKLPPLMV